MIEDQFNLEIYDGIFRDHRQTVQFSGEAKAVIEIDPKEKTIKTRCHGLVREHNFSLEEKTHFKHEFRVVSSKRLARDVFPVRIEFNGENYFLRITHNNNLVLTK